VSTEQPRAAARLKVCRMSGCQALSLRLPPSKLLESKHNLQIFHRQDQAKSKSTDSFGPGTFVDSDPCDRLLDDQFDERLACRAVELLGGELAVLIGNQQH
jgi:hypothetical protein